MIQPYREIKRLHALTGAELASARPRRGDTLRRFINRNSMDRGLPTVVVKVGADGSMDFVLRADWGRTIRKRDVYVLLSRPLGGGGTGGNNSAQVGQIVGLVALLAISGPLGGAAALAGAAGFAGNATATAIAGALIVGGGSILLSHFLAPRPPATLAPEYTVDITSNMARTQQPIPVQHGRVKFFPDLGAPTYSDYSGLDQLFHADLVIGCGEYDIEEVGFGLTPVWTSANGTAAGFPTYKQEIVPPGVDSVLFPTDVAVSSEVSGQQLPDPYGTPYADGSVNEGPNGEMSGIDYVGPFVINGAGTTATQLGVDLVFPGGLYRSTSSGGYVAAEVIVVCQIQAVDDQGVPQGDWSTLFQETINQNSRDPVRLTILTPLTDYGRYQMRIGRTGPQNPTSSTGATTDNVTWAAAKAYLTGPNAVPNVTRLALQIVADKNLSAYSAQQIYVIATRKIPVYDPNSGQMVVQATRNPVWAAVDLWTDPNYGAGLPLSSVDLGTLLSLAEDCDTRGDAFNYRFTAQTDLYSAVAQCLAVSLITPAFPYGQLTAFRDEPRTLPVLQITDFEISRGTLQIGWTFADTQTTDGVITQYQEEQIWRPAEVQYPPGVTLRQPTRIAPQGVTTRQQATVMAAYHYAVDKFRRKTVTLQTFADARRLRRGALVVVQSELPQTWGQALVTDEIDAGSLSISTSVAPDWSGGGPFYVRVRERDGSPFGPVLCLQGSAPNVIVLDAADLARVEGQQGQTWTDVIPRGPLATPTTLEFGSGTPVAFMGLVNTVEQVDSDGMLFSLELALDAQQVYAAYSGASTPTLPAASPLFQSPIPGEIIGISAYVQQEGAGNVLRSNWQLDPASITYLFQVSYDYDGANPDAATWEVAYSGPLAQITPYPVGSDTQIWYRVRGIAASTAPGPWSVGTTAAPAVNLHPTNLGFQVSFDDIAPGTIDPSIAAAADALEGDAFNQLVAQAKNTTAATLAANAQAYDQATTVIALTETVTANRATSTAAITQEAGIRANADEAQATITTALTATVSTNYATQTANLVIEQEARTTADEALSTTIQDLSASTTTSIGQVSASVSDEQEARTTADSALSQSIQDLQASLGTTNASVSAEVSNRESAIAEVNQSITDTQNTQTSNFNSLSSSISSEAATRADADSALSSQVTSVLAQSSQGTAGGIFSLSANSSPGGGLLAVLTALVTLSGASAQQAGYQIQVASDGTASVVFDASKFIIESSGTRQVPFGVENGQIFLQGDTLATTVVKSAALTTSGSTPGQPMLVIDFANGVIDIYDNT